MDANTIQTSIAAFTKYLYITEAGFSKKPLR